MMAAIRAAQVLGPKTVCIIEKNDSLGKKLLMTGGVTAQLIRLMDIEAGGNSILTFFKPDTLAPIALIIGIIMIMFIKKGSAKTVGTIALGFGILFSGLMMMTDAVDPLSESQAFADLLSRFSNMPMLGILTGLVLTVIVQSSSAMVGILQALSSTGAMTFNLVYPIIMGINPKPSSTKASRESSRRYSCSRGPLMVILSSAFLPI